jgi:hypothetical protein
MDNTLEWESISFDRFGIMASWDGEAMYGIDACQSIVALLGYR